MSAGGTSLTGRFTCPASLAVLTLAAVQDYASCLQSILRFLPTIRPTRNSLKPVTVVLSCWAVAGSVNNASILPLPAALMQLCRLLDGFVVPKRRLQKSLTGLCHLSYMLPCRQHAQSELAGNFGVTGFMWLGQQFQISESDIHE